MRGFIAAEAAKKQGSQPFKRFHNALEKAVHEQLLELAHESTLIMAAQQAGLNMNSFQKVEPIGAGQAVLGFIPIRDDFT